MILSRGTAIVKLLKPKYFTNGYRNAHIWNYRVGPPKAPKITIIVAEIAGGFTWWWILWHLFTEYDHITGEFAYPNARNWTDEELGIPDDCD